METLVPLMPSLGERSQKVMQTQKTEEPRRYCFRCFFRNMNSREGKVQLIFQIDRLFRMVHKKETWKITLVLVTSVFNSGKQNLG